MVLNLQHELYFVLTIVLIQLLMPVRWGIVAQHVLENEGCSSRGWHCIGMECSLLKSVVFMPTWQGSLGTQCCIYLCLSLQIHFHFEIFLILFIDRSGKHLNLASNPGPTGWDAGCCWQALSLFCYHLRVLPFVLSLPPHPQANNIQTQTASCVSRLMTSEANNKKQQQLVKIQMGIK